MSIASVAENSAAVNLWPDRPLVPKPGDIFEHRANGLRFRYVGPNPISGHTIEGLESGRQYRVSGDMLSGLIHIPASPNKDRVHAQVAAWLSRRESA